MMQLGRLRVEPDEDFNGLKLGVLVGAEGDAVIEPVILAADSNVGLFVFGDIEAGCPYSGLLRHALNSDGQVGRNLLDGVNAVNRGNFLAVDLDDHVGRVVAFGHGHGEGVVFAILNGLLTGDGVALARGDGDGVVGNLSGHGLQAVVSVVEAVGVGHGVAAGLLVLDDGNIVGYIPLLAVLQLGDSFQAVNGDGAVLVLGDGGILGDLQRFDLGGDRHHVAGVVLIVDGAVLVGDGGADAVLCQRAGRGEDLAVAGAGGGHGRSLAGLILQYGNAAGGIVVGQVDVHGAILGRVCRGDHGRGLGIADDGVNIRLGHGAVAVQVINRDAMAAVGAELAGAGDADVDSAVVHGRRAGGHGVGIALRILDNDFLVVQDLTGIPVDLGVAQNAALGGEEHPVGFGVMGNVGAQVAADTLVGVELLAGVAVEDQQRGAVGVVTACAVIGADDGKLVGDVGARPVEAARSGVSPAGVLDLGSGGVVFVNGIDAGKVGVSVLAVPEACVDVAVLVGDGAVGLSAQLVSVDPQGFQGLGIECLNFAAGQANEDHAVAISHGDDGVAGLINHGAFGHDLTGHAVETADGASGVGVDVAIDHDGRTGGGRPAGAVLHSPQKLRVLRSVGGLGVGDAKVVVAVAEVAPLGSDASVEVRVLRGHSQSNVDGAALAELEGALLADIAVTLHEVGVLGVSHDGILAVRGSNSLLVGIPDSYLGVGGVNGEADLDGCQSGNGDGVGVGIAAGVGDDHVDLVLTKIQRNGGVAAAVDGDGVAFITGSRRNGNALGGSGRGVSRLGSGESLREPDAVQRQGGQARRNSDGGELVLILEVAVHNGDGHGVDLRAGGREACQILAAGFAGGQLLCLLGINVKVYPLGRDGRAAASVDSLRRPCVEHVGVVRHEHGVFLDRRVESRNQLEHLRLGLGACVAELQNGQAGRRFNDLGHALDSDGQVGGNILNGVAAVGAGNLIAVDFDDHVSGVIAFVGSYGEAVVTADSHELLARDGVGGVLRPADVAANGSGHCNGIAQVIYVVYLERLQGNRRITKCLGFELNVKGIVPGVKCAAVAADAQNPLLGIHFHADSRILNPEELRRLGVKPEGSPERFDIGRAAGAEGVGMTEGIAYGEVVLFTRIFRKARGVDDVLLCLLCDRYLVVRKQSSRFGRRFRRFGLNGLSRCGDFLPAALQRKRVYRHKAERHHKRQQECQ